MAINQTRIQKEIDRVRLTPNGPHWVNNKHIGSGYASSVQKDPPLPVPVNEWNI